MSYSGITNIAFADWPKLGWMIFVDEKQSKKKNKREIQSVSKSDRRPKSLFSLWKNNASIGNKGWSTAVCIKYIKDKTDKRK